MKINDVATLFAASLKDSDLSAKQQAVLEASLQLFAEKGFDATSTSDIAALAGVSEGTVYKHFKTKAGLLDAILAPAAEQVVPRLAGEFAGVLTDAATLSFEAFLTAIIADRLTFAWQNRAVIKIIASEALRRPALLKQLTGRLGDLYAQKLVPVLEHYQATGELATMPMATIARDLVGVMASAILPMVLVDAEVDIDAAAASGAHFLVKGLAPE